MSTEGNKKKNLLEAARLRINLSLVILLMGMILILQGLYFPNPFASSPEEVAVEDVAPDFSVDPSEIVNGIHEPSGLIAEEGFEIVLNICGKCHSLDLVIQNKATKEGWKDMIVWMQKTQGLWDLGEYELPILAYLANNYGLKL